jgi:cytoskeleton protein RodZ
MVGMESGVGASLREARKRRELDLTDVEAAIKIRVRYLQAIEDENWEVLPGDVYARGFIRTYAGYLGLDGERLADEHRRATGGDERDDHGMRRVEPVGSAVAARGRRHLSPRMVIAGVALGVAAAFFAVEGLVR